MNLWTRCTRCGKTYRAADQAERRDPTRECARCYIETHQPPFDLFQSPEAPVKATHRPSFPAASAAGLSDRKE